MPELSGYPQSGVDTLEDIVKEKPGWGIARAMLADGLCELAYATGDPKLAKRAAREISVAKVLHPQNQFVDSIELAVITTEYVFATREPMVKDEQVGLLINLGNSLAGRLDPRVTNSPFGNRAVGEFYAATGQYELAADVWEYLLSTYHSQGAAFFYAPLALLIDRAPNWERADSLTGYYILSNQRKRAVSDMLETKLWNNPMGRAWRPNHLHLLGLNSELEEAMENAKPVTEGYTWWISDVAKMIIQEWPEERFLKSVGEDQWQRSHHLFVVAFERLTDPERRGEAIDALEQAIALDMRTADFHYWSLAMLKILNENPAWPASLRAGELPSN